jgi:hypothetical protein
MQNLFESESFINHREYHSVSVLILSLKDLIDEIVNILDDLLNNNE